jgi:hypothetical protein
MLDGEMILAVGEVLKRETDPNRRDEIIDLRDKYSDPIDREISCLLILGYTPCEISRYYRATEAWVSWRLRRMVESGSGQMV